MPFSQLKFVLIHAPFPREKAILFGYVAGVWVVVFREESNVVSGAFGKQAKPGGKYASKTDEELLKMHLKSDRHAFNVFFKRHEARLKKVAFRAANGQARVVDPAFSDFSMAFFKRLEEGQEAFVQQMLPNISAYMSAWVRNKVRDYYRSKAGRQEAATISLSIAFDDDEDGGGVQRDIADEHTSAQERWREFYECVSKLIWAKSLFLERELKQARSETERKKLIREQNKYSREAGLLENMARLMVIYGFTQEQVAEKLNKDRKTLRQRGERLATIYKECGV